MSILSKIPNPPGFPLLKLPLLAIECVLKQIKPDYLIHLSFTSKKLHRLISRQKFEFEMELAIHNAYFTFYFDTSRRPRVGTWYVQNDEKRGTPVFVNGYEVFNSFDEFGLRSYTPGSRIQFARSAWEYLENLFVCEKTSIFIRPDNIIDPDLFDLSVFGPTRFLEIDGSKTIKNEHLTRVLSTCQPTESIRFGVGIEDDYRLDMDSWHRPKRIHLANAHMITEEMFLDFKSSYILLINCPLTHETCLTFIRNWFHSTDTQFYFLLLHWNLGYDKGIDDWNIDELGLKLTPFDANRRNPNFRAKEYLAFSMVDALDFEREDGLLASVLFDYRHLVFCVWHERFPDVTGCRLYN